MTTATQPRMLSPHRPSRVLDREEMRRRTLARRVRRDLVDVSGWTIVAAAVACYLADRGDYGWSSTTQALTSLGVVGGLVATATLLLQVLLVARIPFVDRAIGHDEAIQRHKSLTGVMTWALGAHIWFLLAARSVPERSLLGGLGALWSVPDLAFAIVGVGLLGGVVVTSDEGIRSRLPRELWHGLHLLAYVGLALSIPHQFSEGGVFAEGTSHAFWVLLLSATAAAVIAFRVVRPLVNSIDHSLTVARVTPVSADAVEIVLVGRALDQLDVQPGQFLSWRFWTPSLFWHQHPFSVSSAPDGRTLAITVRALGAGSQAITRVPQGTKVSFEGPFGVVTPQSRTRPGLVLAGAGVGIAPLVSLLESMPTTPGMATVVVRGSHPHEIPHLERIALLCQERGARLVPLMGPRAEHGWSSDNHPGLRLVDLAPWLDQADVYVCGPRSWSESVLADARNSGVSEEQLHNERFDW